MKMNSNILKCLGIVLTLAVYNCIDLNGQDRNAVVEAYNEGAKTMQTDTKAAIKAFENVINLAEKAGGTADDLKEKAIQVLPGLYVKEAAAAASQKKPPTEIVRAAKAALAASEKYGNKASQENAQRILIQGYNAMGSGYFSKKDYENAVKSFDSLLAVNPDYNPALFNKALIYRAQNDPESFEKTMDAYIENLRSANDTEKLNQATSMALEYFRAAGSQANQANNLDEALAQLDKAAKYGDDKDLFYYYADVYNKQKKFDKGEEFARKGLEMEQGAAEAKAKFYFQLGLAQAGKNQTAEACESFRNSLYGTFAEPSKAQRTNLKCK
jgi:tetratricopeptide (TPR) repeat protein